MDTLHLDDNFAMPQMPIWSWFKTHGNFRMITVKGHSYLQFKAHIGRNQLGRINEWKSFLPFITISESDGDYELSVQGDKSLSLFCSFLNELDANTFQAMISRIKDYLAIRMLKPCY
ncbi:MAG: hypothetical protein L0287_01235 [Anaerolineae bacterium]|nr:hypothetical protein [Anaerolineae bacterium]